MIKCSCGHTQPFDKKIKICDACGEKYIRTPTVSPSFSLNSKIMEVASEKDKRNIIDFLKQEMEMDSINHQEMLNVVDLTTMTKAKITALGKLGNTQKKDSLAMIKKYITAGVRDYIEERRWLRS